VTIKEMEEKTQMSRTNIRFYESEGLIHPNRRENGYREYSESDARILMKVKLLRSMDIPLDQVKAAAFGEKQLCEILTELEAELDRRQIHQERTRLALRQLKQDGTAFDNLNPEELFPLLESETEVEDAPPRLNLPWRRYWARYFDLSLYSTAVSLVLYGFLDKEILTTLLTLLAMVILEPLFLKLFGTTPGKAIFGIRVTDLDGNRLDYETAMERTWTVMWEGMALNIPLISMYFQYKSLSAAEDDIPLSWEDDSELTFRDDKSWRYILLVLGHLALFAISNCFVSMMGG
jgi:DNA-binding transcriptional MerR regulator